ncbi:MAG: AraC family transcriptional regulator, partial [Pedobacter sp.]
MFGLSAAELDGEMPAVQDCFGPTGRSLQERILFAADNQQRARILSACLLEKVRRNKTPELNIHALVKHMLYHRQAINIEQVAARYYVSQRQLERKFKSITGYTPKTYSRISRFQHALNTYGSSFKNL